MRNNSSRMINFESTPWFICKEGDKNYCAYVDTDSNYYNAEPLLRHLYPNFDEMDDEERDNKLEEIALKYQDLITDYYSEMSVAPDWYLGILFGIGGFFGMYLGAKCQKYIPAHIIKLILCFCVLFVSAKYVIDF